MSGLCLHYPAPICIHVGAKRAVREPSTRAVRQTWLAIAALTGFCGSAGAYEDNVNRAGMDYTSVTLPTGNTADDCFSLCYADAHCVAWTYVKAGVQGSSPRCWLKATIPPARPDECCVSGRMQANNYMADYDRPGGDYTNFAVPQSYDALYCQRMCIADDICAAWSYVKKGIQGPEARCWLKKTAPLPVRNKCCTSGRR